MTRPASADNRPLARVRVLFVDDNPHVIDGIGAVLRHSGAHVETAQSGADALACFAAARAHVLLIDYAMPGMSGTELLLQIRNLPGEAERPTPAILFTGEPHLAGLARASGFTSYLTKPLNPRVLIDEIARLAGV